MSGMFAFGQTILVNKPSTDPSLPKVEKITESGYFVAQKKQLNTALDSLYASNLCFNESVDRLDTLNYETPQINFPTGTQNNLKIP